MSALGRARAALEWAGRLAFWLLLSGLFFFRHLLPAWLRGRRAAPAVRRMLVISSADYLGDAILRGAFVKLLKLKYPDAEISIATNDHVVRNYAALYLEHGDADRLLQYPLRLYKHPIALLRFLGEVAAGRFDLLVLVPYFTYDRLADGFALALFRLAGIPRRIGYCVEGLRPPRFLTSRVALRPLSQNWYEMVQAYGRALKLDSASLASSLVPFVYSAGSGEWHTAGRQVGVHIGGGARVNRRWPLEHFATVCKALCQAGCQVTLLGDAGDSRETAAVAQSVLQDKSDAQIVNLAGAPLSRSIAALQQCDVFVGNDSGPMHLAAALGVPIVAIFGPSDLRLYRPDRLDSRHTVIAAGCPARQDRLVLFRDAGEECGCTLSYDPAAPAYPRCLRQIEPQQVLDAVLAKL